MDVIMKVLSIRQPFAGLIVQGVKRVENRSWATPYRGIIAIHAGKKNEKQAFTNAQARWDGYDPRKKHPMIEDVFNTFGAIIGIATLERIILPGSRRKIEWYSGEYGWILTDPIPIPPIPIKGKLGLWTPDQETKKYILDHCNL